MIWKSKCYLFNYSFTVCRGVQPNRPSNFNFLYSLYFRNQFRFWRFSMVRTAKFPLVFFIKRVNIHASWIVCHYEALQSIPSRVFKSEFVSYLYILLSFLSDFPSVKMDMLHVYTSVYQDIETCIVFPRLSLQSRSATISNANT